MQDENGWIKLYRKIQDNDLWLSEKFTKAQAWVDMLLLANHKDNMFYLRGNEIHVKRGQIARSEASLARRWKWSREKVRRFLSFLKTRQQIRQQQSNIINILTIINYSEYQENKTTDKTTEKQQKNTNNNDKNVKNEKKQNIYSCFFDQIWQKYPNKDGKKIALKHFQTSVKTETDLININKALDNYLKSKRVKNGFIKNGSTWFNNWTDWIEYKESVNNNIMEMEFEE